jgi:hypothetical protein
MVLERWNPEFHSHCLAKIFIAGFLNIQDIFQDMFKYSE